jgi:23S rRNA (pseudouridine1915-N3)-methyltransferase
MRVRVIAVGDRMPIWVDEVCADYLRRLGSKLKVSLIEVAAGPRRRAGASAHALQTEGERVLAQLRPDEYVVALDERGRELSSVELAGWLRERMQDGRDAAFIIGGPDGLAATVLERSDFTWSLSRLTLPHALVRVLLSEQLYRAHTLLSGHPYHRA